LDDIQEGKRFFPHSLVVVAAVLALVPEFGGRLCVGLAVGLCAAGDDLVSKMAVIPRSPPSRNRYNSMVHLQHARTARTGRQSRV
jgi:hypothetical protein